MLDVIATDEARHAALAWKTLRWVLSQEPTLGARLEWLLRARLADVRTSERPGCAELGVLSGPERSRLEQDVLSSLVGPILRTLVADVADGVQVSGQR